MSEKDSTRPFLPIWLHVAFWLCLTFGGGYGGTMLGIWLSGRLGLKNPLAFALVAGFFIAGFFVPARLFQNNVAARCGKCGGKAWFYFETRYKYRCESCDQITDTHIEPAD